ncbi:2-hydroxyacid dehydrogenase [Gemmobacter sp.]|uniref:2-hydroxyacid dehydrogenase n=1 Tax=Gemmobacter sp. TaxID=1898957 RepID=UPI002AFF5B86|nr:NAD(P)-dependent oxidoreductase [Gemmobacter sp.]
MARIVYIDCSDLMAEMLARVWPDHGAAMKVYVGDMPAADLPGWCQGAEVVWNGHTMMGADLMDQLPDLRRIIFLGSGPSSYIDMAAAAARGIVVDRIAGYGDRAVAEQALALILAGARDLTRMDRDLRRGHWDPREGKELLSRRLGLIGFGGIAQALAGMARALGMQVSVWNRSPLPADWADAAAPLDAVLAQSDIVSLHLALTPDTRGFLSAERLAQMKPGAMLVNTARAGLVDTAALIAALEAGHLGHAALDVFDTEPLPADDPLLAAPNVTLTAHAGFKTREATERLVAQAVALTLG